MSEKLFQSAEQEIIAINRARLKLKTGILEHLYPYQEDLIRSIYENKCTIAYKARNIGCTVVYLIHLVMVLHRCYNKSKKDYEECNFIIFTPNQMMAKLDEDFVKEMIYQIGDKDFMKTGPSHFKYISSRSLDRLRGYPHREITEVFLDEFEFFQTEPDVLHLGVFDIQKIVGITSKNRGEKTNLETLNNFIEEYSKGDLNVMMIPWYHCPRFNQNLKWAKGDKVIAEPTFDSEGNIKYRPFVWLSRAMDGWIPYNKWRNDRVRMGIKNEELLELTYFQNERNEQNLPKFDTWS